MICTDLNLNFDLFVIIPTPSLPPPDYSTHTPHRLFHTSSPRSHPRLLIFYFFPTTTPPPRPFKSQIHGHLFCACARKYLFTGYRLVFRVQSRISALVKDLICLLNLCIPTCLFSLFNDAA